MKCKNKLFWDTTGEDQEDEAATTKTIACFLLFFALSVRSSTYEQIALRQNAPLWKAQLQIISCTMAPCDSGLPICKRRQQSDLLLSKCQIIGSPEDVIVFFLCCCCCSCPLYTVCVNFGSHCFKCYVTDRGKKNPRLTEAETDTAIHFSPIFSPGLQSIAATRLPHCEVTAKHTQGRRKLFTLIGRCWVRSETWLIVIN